MPADNGIGEGGLAPANSSSASPAPVSKTAKPKGGGVVADTPIAAKTAGFETKPALKSYVGDKVFNRRGAEEEAQALIDAELSKRGYILMDSKAK